MTETDRTWWPKPSKTEAMHEFRGSLMQAEIESIWPYPHTKWHHDNLAGSAGWAAITDDPMSESELYIALPGAPQDHIPFYSETFSIVCHLLFGFFFGPCSCSSALQEVAYPSLF